MSIYLVVEDTGEQYEAMQWPIAAFTDKTDASIYCFNKTREVHEKHIEGVRQGTLRDKEVDAVDDSMSNAEYDAAIDAIYAKYPDARDEGDTLHQFYTRGPMPLNPEV